MSVYLGQDKVGVSYQTKGSTYENNRTIMQNEIYTPWTRPEGWPDLDSLNLEMSGTESFIYMTYRTGHVDDRVGFAWTLVNEQSITIEVGTIENGQFISNDSVTYTTNTGYGRIFSEEAGYSEGYAVIKVTGRFSKFYLSDISGTSSFKYYMQPMLERIWYVPELTHFYNGSSASTTGNGTMTLERDKIGNGDGTALVSTYDAWYGCYRLQSLDISELKTPNITNSQYMFQQCRALEHLDVTQLDLSKVTTISYMFDGCVRLQELDLRNWNTEKLTGNGITYLFRNCYALKYILGLDKLYINNITSLAGMFVSCLSLIDFSGITYWNTSNVINLSSTFYNCSSLKIVNLSHWNVEKVTTINSMFYNCQNLEHISFPSGPTATLTGTQNSVFYCCYNLQEVDLSWIKPITSATTSLGYFFYQCRSLSEINIPEGWDVTGCTTSEAFYRIFSNCYKLQKITGISNWDMSGYNYTFGYAFENNFCLKELNIKNWYPHPTTMYNAFYNCRALEQIDLTGWSWENMTGTALYCTFYGCSSLKNIKGIEHMGDSGNITSFGSTFQDCHSLASIPNINSWDPAKVTTCATMFASCYSLQSLTITNWSLPKCTTIANMFRYCYSMLELELTGWTLSALTTAPDYIFCDLYCLRKCSGLPIGLNHRYQNALSLPEDQWARIFTQLPTVSNKTLYMTTANINRLSAETKAIATNKGWTLAN